MSGWTKAENIDGELWAIVRAPRCPIEWELDPVTMERTGRVRLTQWAKRTLRREAVPPSQRGDMPFRWPHELGIELSK